MTFTLTPINVPNFAGASTPLYSFTDGTNNAVAHVLLDTTGSIVAPATSGNQGAMIASLGTIATNSALLSTSALQTAGNASLAAIATNSANLLPKGQATSANSSPVVLASDQTLPLPTGAATAANQATGNTSLATIATAVQAATPAGANIIGKVGIDQTTPGATNGVQINAALPAGANSIGAVTANAGTNLNTSALALDTSVNGILVSQGSTTSGQKGSLIQAAVSTSAPTLTTGQTNPLSLDTAGNLRVNVVAGGASGGTSSGFAAAFPGNGTAMGAKNGANMVNLTADGSSNLNVNLQTAVPAGTAIIGKVGIDQTTPGTTNGVQVNAALPAGSNTIGNVGLAAGSAKIGSVAIDQTTPGTTNLVAANITGVAGSAISQGHGTAATAIRVELPTDGTGVVGIAAGSNTIGGVTLPGSVHLTAAPTVTAGAYTTGQVVGGLISLASATRVNSGSGVIQSVNVTVKTALTAPFDVLFFDTNPTNSTFTDNAALAVNTADLPSLCGVAHCTDLVSLGTPQMLQALNLAIPFKLSAAAETLYAVIVMRGAETFASTSAVGLSVLVMQD